MSDVVERIGKYEILEKIGEGGFGVVYHGRDPFIKRPVALKTCTSENEEVRRRFFREAEIAGNLHHPNIVTIHDFGLDGDLPFLVQEFLPGEDLDTFIAAGKGQSLECRLDILLQIAEALDYAHQRGVIHRDIKPANIRVLAGNRVKVMDFGIARLKDQETRLTRTGMTLGTVAYLSPEQLRGQGIDHRADIFSFGVVAYELLCGRRPFDAPTLPQLFYALVNQAPRPLDERAPDCPAAVARIVHRCLEKVPDRRYPSFAELLPELQAIGAADGGEAPADGTVSLPPELTAPAVRPHGNAANEPPPSLERLAIQVDLALEDEDLERAERHLTAARRAHGESLVRAALGPQMEKLARASALREERIRQAAALLVGESESSAPTDEFPAPEIDEPSRPATGAATEDLLAEAWRRIEGLLEAMRIEEAGIHISRLRPLLGNHPTFRRLEQRFKRARQWKRTGHETPPSSSPPRAPGKATPATQDHRNREEKPEEERAATIHRIAEEVEADLRRGRLNEAEARLEEAGEDPLTDPTLQSLAARIAHVRTLTKLQDLVGRGRKAAAAGGYEEAQHLALEALKIDAGHLEAKALFKRAQTGQRRLRRAKERRDR